MPKLIAMRRQTSRLAIAMMAVAVLAACGGKEQKKAAGQAIARVNKEELTVHQLNFLLQQQRGLKPEQTEAASRQVLERLIDQELAVPKAAEMKLDRDARVLAQLEAARREILSRSYFDRVGDAAPKPTATDIKKYYEENPALFSERRVYQLQEINIEVAADKVPSIQEALKAAKSAAEFLNYLRNNNLRFAGNQVVRGAEQIPLSVLPQLSKLKDGETLFSATPGGATVLVLVGSRSQPVDEASAKPAIEQFLVNERKRRMVADDLKALRGTAEITYLGKFAEGVKGAAAPAAAPTPSPADVAASAVSTMPAAAAPAASAALNSNSVSKGLGLK
ncbi:MAG: EpsD family peptidyl-prolyl cis-trans isomerase [Rubrivivax sp.]